MAITEQRRGTVERYSGVEKRIVAALALHSLLNNAEKHTDDLEGIIDSLEEFVVNLEDVFGEQAMVRAWEAVHIVESTDPKKIQVDRVLESEDITKDERSDIIRHRKYIINEPNNIRVVEQGEYDQIMDHLRQLLGDDDISVLTNLLFIVQRAKVRLEQIAAIDMTRVHEYVGRAIQSTSVFRGGRSFGRAEQKDVKIHPEDIVSLQHFGDGIGVVLKHSVYQKYIATKSIGANDGVGGVFFFAHDGSGFETKAILRHERGHQVLSAAIPAAENLNPIDFAKCKLVELHHRSRSVREYYEKINELFSTVSAEVILDETHQELAMAIFEHNSELLQDGEKVDFDALLPAARTAGIWLKSADRVLAIIERDLRKWSKSDDLDRVDAQDCIDVAERIMQLRKDVRSQFVEAIEHLRASFSQVDSPDALARFEVLTIFLKPSQYKLHARLMKSSEQ